MLEDTKTAFFTDEKFGDPVRGRQKSKTTRALLVIQPLACGRVSVRAMREIAQARDSWFRTRPG
jgi:hypothetical protein